MTYDKYWNVIIYKTMKDRRIWTFKQFCAYFAWPTFYGMRNFHAKRKEKGFEKAFLKVGKRVLIDVDKFWELIEETQKKED